MFLFLQVFGSGTWVPKVGEDDTCVLTLHSSADGLLLGSTRPHLGQVPMQRLLDALGFTPDNPPNAALVAEHGEHGGEQEILIIELCNSAYDPDSGALTYDARVLVDCSDDGLAHLAAQQEGSMSESFGAGSLFIDDCPNGEATCDGSSAGRIKGIGCCWNWNELGCRACNHDGDSDSSGESCAVRYPDACCCTGGYPCHGGDRACHDTVNVVA